MKVRPYTDTDKEAGISLWEECGLLIPQNDPTKDIERKLKVDPDLFLAGLVLEADCIGVVVAATQ